MKETMERRVTGLMVPEKSGVWEKDKRNRFQTKQALSLFIFSFEVTF